MYKVGDIIWVKHKTEGWESDPYYIITKVDKAKNLVLMESLLTGNETDAMIWGWKNRKNVPTTFWQSVEKISE